MDVEKGTELDLPWENQSYLVLVFSFAKYRKFLLIMQVF